MKALIDIPTHESLKAYQREHRDGWFVRQRSVRRIGEIQTLRPAAASYLME